MSSPSGYKPLTINYVYTGDSYAVLRAISFEEIAIFNTSSNVITPTASLGIIYYKT